MASLAPNPYRHTLHRGHVPFVFLLLALLLGVVMAHVLEPRLTLYVAVWTVLGIALVAFVAVAWTTRLKRHRYYGVLSALVFLVLAAVGFIRAWQPHPRIDPNHFSHVDAVALRGYVADEPVVRGAQLRFPVTVTHAVDTARQPVKVTGRLMLTVRLADTPAAVSSLRFGDMLLFPADFQPVPPPYNPGELDYRRYLANKGLWHQAYLHGDRVQRLGSDHGNRLTAYALRLRQRMVDKFARYIDDRDALSVASTLILGYRADLRADLLQAYANTGTIHVLSVSGMHVVIVFWLLSKACWWMDRRKGLRALKFVILLSAVWAYALVTGFSPSVLRASIMIGFVMAAATFGQRNRVYNSIAASAFFLLLYNPLFIGDIGFQLSYLAVLGIVALMPLFAQVWSTRNRMGKPVVDYVHMSVAAQAGAGPLAAYHFHQFPLYFLPANLFIVIPASGIMYLGFALLLLPSGTLAWWVGKALEGLIACMNEVLHGLEQLPLASITGLWVTGWETAVIYLLMISMALAWLRRSRLWAYGAVGCVALLVLASFSRSIARVTESQIVLFNVRREVAIGFIHRGQAWVYSGLASQEDRTFRYSVTPWLERYASEDRIHFIPQAGRHADGFVYVRDPIIQFGRHRVMVYDGTKAYAGQLDVSILLLRDDPRISLAQIMRNIHCDRVVLDGSNQDPTIERIVAEAQAMGKPVYVLKDNPALCITLAE